MQELASNLFELADVLTDDLPPVKRGPRTQPTKQMYITINALRDAAHQLLVLDTVTDDYKDEE